MYIRNRPLPSPQSPSSEPIFNGVNEVTQMMMKLQWCTISLSKMKFGSRMFKYKYREIKQAILYS